MISDTFLASTGGAAAFTPTSLGSLLKRWGDPTDPTITKDGSNGVTSYPDKSTFGNGAIDTGVSATRPILTPAAYHGLPMLRFSAGLGQNLVSASAQNIFAPGEARTVFMVFANGTAAPGDNGRLFRYTVGGNGFYIGVTLFGGKTSPYFDVSTNFQGITTPDLTAPHLLMVSWTGVTTDKVVVELDGVAQTVTFTAGTHTSTETGTAGWTYADPSLPFICDRGDDVHCTTVLGSTDKGNVKTFLMSKWGIP